MKARAHGPGATACQPPALGRWPRLSDSAPWRFRPKLPSLQSVPGPARRRASPTSSAALLQRLGIDLYQDHGEVFVFGAALMRRAARHHNKIALLNFKSLAVDNLRTTPFARVSLFR